MPSTPTKPTRWQRWRILCYGILGIAFVLALFYAYTKYEEHREWARIDELLAEQDKKHPGWRWHEFLPKPLQPGEVNGALRFIEVGKQLSDEMLTGTDIPDSDHLGYQSNTKEWLTTVKRDSVRSNYQTIRERCKHLEKELPNLAAIQPGCPRLSSPRPSAEFALGDAPIKGNEPPLVVDQRTYQRQFRWLNANCNYFIAEGKGNEAALAWRAMLASAITDVPGRVMFYSRRRGYDIAFDTLYQLLAMSEPDETVLRDLQQSVVDWRSHLLTLDDIAMDRAWIVQFLDEMRANNRDTFFERVQQMYAKPPAWLHDAWQEKAAQLGIGTPSIAAMFRMEYQSHLRLLDLLEEKLRADQPFESAAIELMHDHIAIPGAHFNVYFQPRWKKILADVSEMHGNLRCMEALIAAERYRLKHGDFPKQWTDLVPSLLKSIPQANDLQFTLKPVPEGLVIYLPREKNHGGKVLRAFDPDTNILDTDTDDGLIIFYPKHRRQPPPPVKPKE